MKRLIPALTFALVVAVAAHAQETETTVKSKTRSSGGEAKKVTYIGCIQGGTQSKTFVLDKVTPVSRTTTTDLQTGESKTSTSYAIIPGEVKVQEHVGRKVEVTGMLIPGANIRTETVTEIEREDAKDTKIRERTETKNAMPQFQVTSIKDLGERCD
jgi:hypothetical protein